MSSASVEDLADIRASLRGDGQAYARLLRRYQPEMTRYLWRFTRDRRALEELVQELFVQAYFSLRSYRARSPFEHWLRRIATRVGYRYWKLRRRESVNVALDHAEQSIAPQVDALDAKEAARLLYDLLGELPPRDRLVLTLMAVESRSVAETAELTGWSQTMVKVQAHRARARLKKLLQQREVWP